MEKTLIKQRIALLGITLLALVSCGGGGGGGASTPNAGTESSASERTFPSVTNIYGGNFQDLIAKAKKTTLPTEKSWPSGFFSLSCTAPDGGCEMVGVGATGTPLVDYANSTITKTTEANGNILLTFTNPSSQSVSMLFDTKGGLLRDPRGCTYSKPFQLLSDIPLSVNYAFSTAGTSITRTCPTGVSTETWYGRRWLVADATWSVNRWIYDAFDSNGKRIFQMAFSVDWNVTANKLGNIMLFDLYEYALGTGVQFHGYE